VPGGAVLFASGSTALVPLDPLLMRAGCTSAPTLGRALWFTVDLVGGTRWVELDTAGSTFDTQLSVLDVCDPSSPSWTCVATNDDDNDRRTARLTLGDGLSERDHLLVAVHGYGSQAGAVELRVRCAAATTPSTTLSPTLSQTLVPWCPPPPVLRPLPLRVCGDLVTGTTPLTASRVPAACAAAISLGRGVWYALDVPPGGAQVDLSTAGSSFDTQLSLYSCTLACLARNDDDFKTLTSRIRSLRLTTGRYYVLVHGYATGSGAYVLRTTCV
jgi:hypothetical protein